MGLQTGEDVEVIVFLYLLSSSESKLNHFEVWTSGARKVS